LNREAALPQPDLVATPGVWPRLRKLWRVSRLFEGVVTMRVHVDADRIERYFTSFTDSKPNLRSRRRSRFMFSPGQTSPTNVVDMGVVVRRTFIFLVSVAAYFVIFIFLFLTAIVATILHQYRHHIHHIHWRLLRLLYGIALDIFFGRYPPMQYATTIFVFSTLGFAWLIALRWAWNRRAKRLNYESTLPQPVLVIAPGVWPPPPDVPISANLLPKK